ncbi:MAG: nitroreductase family protein, partial [Bacteroidales bacterium]
GSVNKEALHQDLAIDKRYEIRYVLALGKPVEQVVIEPVVDNEIRYWRSQDGTHHVPKRSLEEVLI